MKKIFSAEKKNLKKTLDDESVLCDDVLVMETTTYRVGDKVKLSRTLTVQIVGQDIFRGIPHWDVLHIVSETSKPTVTFYGLMSMSALENMNGVKL